MFSKLLDSLERKIGRHKGIRNLMTIVVIGTVFVYLADIILPLISGRTLTSLLAFSKNRIMRGEIWRLITFVFVPTTRANLLMMAFGLYFDWLMGDMLQNYWGTFRFTVFYTVGMLGAVIAGCITGSATAYYLNMSLMLAMACIHPDMQLRLYGMLNLKLKWLAVISLVMMLIPLLQYHADWQEVAALVAALINVILFFADKLIGQIRTAWRHYQWKKNWHSGWKR